jgi:glycosyltransferase involved in cell wall biosynthesis
MDQRMIIGFGPPGYPSNRNITVVPGVTYRRVRDVHAGLRAAARPLRFLPGVASRVDDLAAQFRDFDLNRVDLLHFFNVVSQGCTPWIVTFETVVPRMTRTVTCHQGAAPSYAPLRGARDVTRALDALAGPHCRRIVALSACAAEMQRALLREFPDHREAIERKLVVLHPPQSRLLARYDEKPVEQAERGERGERRERREWRVPHEQAGAIRFAFVGASFFRKGGVETVETLERLRRERAYPIQLTVVSSLRIDAYATRETPADVARARQLLERNADWVAHVPHASNSETLGLMRASHVGLLPTHADTYGYAVLEFQAAGCPVITTNVRALPEINDNDQGWLIEVPRNPLGEAIYATADQRAELSSAIRAGIERVVHEIFDDRDIIRRKAELGLVRIARQHSPEAHAAALARIYREALDGREDVAGRAAQA